MNRRMCLGAWMGRAVAGIAIGLVGLSLCSCEGTRMSRAIESIVTPTASAVGPKVELGDEPEIRVRTRAGVKSVSIGVPGDRAGGGSGGRVYVRAGGGYRTQVMLTPVTMEVRVGAIRVTDRSGASQTFGEGMAVEVLAVEGERSDVSRVVAGGVGAARLASGITVDGMLVPGFAVVRPREDSAMGLLDVALSMPLESYVSGVVSKEMPAAWPRQALEAQSVAARTYAMFERDRARRGSSVTTGWYDIEGTEADQTFGSIPKSSAVVEAVAATRGMVLSWRGGLIRAYYSSTCGGRPASGRDVWGSTPAYDFNSAEPLQGSPRESACQGSKSYRWEATRDAQDLSVRLRSWVLRRKADTPVLSRVRAVEVSRRNSAGRPVEYRVTDSDGEEVVLAAEEMRAALNYTATGLAPIALENQVLSGDMDIEIWADVVRLHGRGSGHGVGMCQHCAKGFAEQGVDWREMMRRFYPTAEVVRAY